MKERYRQHCSTEPSIPLFSRDWWLDAVVGSDAWDAIVVESDGRVQASMPYTIRKKFGLTISTQPRLTQCLGPWTRPHAGKTTTRLTRQKHLLEELIRKLPSFDYFLQKWHWSQTNWLPFYWAGFQQTTRYTYILNDLSDLGRVWNGLDQSIRTDIRKAERRFGLTLCHDADTDSFIDLNRMVFQRQGRPMPYPDSLVRRIIAACNERGAGHLYIARDVDGRAHAGIYVVRDEFSSYYLMAGADPALRSSGAMSYCIWRAIQCASKQGGKFDFEGSMIAPVERFVRAFGAEQVPYFQLKRVPSRLLSVIDAFRNVPAARRASGVKDEQ